MKKLVVLLLVSLMASVAFAGIDPDTDSFGVYFDPAGNTINATAGLFTPFPVYLLLMNPAGTTDGFECTVTPTGPAYFILSTTLPAGSLDIDPSANGFAVGAAQPFTASSGAMVLCTWTFMLQGATPLEFYITKATNPSMAGNLPVVTGNGILRRCGTITGDVTLPVARCNGTGLPPIIATEVSSFGNVKSLFR
jgi:hypothetical protein